MTSLEELRLKRGIARLLQERAVLEHNRGNAARANVRASDLIRVQVFVANLEERFKVIIE